MTVLAFLPHAWLQPGKFTDLLAHSVALPDVAERLVEKNPVGKRIKRVFGTELFGRIHWTFASLEVGTCAGFHTVPNTEHMRHMVAQSRPDLVLVFGKLVKAAIPPIYSGAMLYCRWIPTDDDLAVLHDRVKTKNLEFTMARCRERQG